VSFTFGAMGGNVRGAVVTFKPIIGMTQFAQARLLVATYGAVPVFGGIFDGLMAAVHSTVLPGLLNFKIWADTHLVNIVDPAAMTAYAANVLLPRMIAQASQQPIAPANGDGWAPPSLDNIAQLSRKLGAPAAGDYWTSRLLVNMDSTMDPPSAPVNQTWLG
jgi:hypothetical protein